MAVGVGLSCCELAHATVRLNLYAYVNMCDKISITCTLGQQERGVCLSERGVSGKNGRRA